MLRTLFSYESVPDLPRRVVDMANADYQKHHRGRKSWDINFCNAVAEANERVLLEMTVMENPGQTVRGMLWEHGFVPRGVVEFDDRLDIERWVVTREIARKNKDFAEADRIRRLAEYFDFIIEDGKKGTYWFKKR